MACVLKPLLLTSDTSTNIWTTCTNYIFRLDEPFHCQRRIWSNEENFLTLSCPIKSKGLTIQIKALDEYLLIVMAILLLSKGDTFYAKFAGRAAIIGRIWNQPVADRCVQACPDQTVGVSLLATRDYSSIKRKQLNRRWQTWLSELLQESSSLEIHHLHTDNFSNK